MPGGDDAALHPRLPLLPEARPPAAAAARGSDRKRRGGQRRGGRRRAAASGVLRAAGEGERALQVRQHQRHAPGGEVGGRVPRAGVPRAVRRDDAARGDSA